MPENRYSLREDLQVIRRATLDLSNASQYIPSNLKSEMHGYYIRRLGALVLYTRMANDELPVLHAQLHEPNMTSPSTLTTPRHNASSVARALEVVEDGLLRRRSLASTEECLFRLELQLAPSSFSANQSAAPLKSVMLGKGSITALNCNRTLTINMKAHVFQEEEIIARAFRFALLMGMVTIIQICVLVQQLQHTQTQASLSRVSLVTLGVQTVFDSCVFFIAQMLLRFGHLRFFAMPPDAGWC